MRKAFYSNILFGFLSLFSFTSCAIYQQEFDCPPPCGVPCTSETDLESMIIETNKGPDIFVPGDKDCSCSCRKCKDATPSTSLNRRVWICHDLTEDEYGAQGHYIYQTAQNIPCCVGSCDLEESKIQLMPSKR
jgi:conjugal transfer pilus assembly protein TraV